MSTPGSTKKTNNKDYDKEIKDVLSHALKKVNPKILRTIELIEKLNFTSQNKLEITNSNSGTSF